MRLKAKYRELAAANDAAANDAAANDAAATTPARQRGHAGDGRGRHRPNRAPARSGKAHAELAAVSSAR